LRSTPNKVRVQRILADTLPFEAVSERIAVRLKAAIEERALRAVPLSILTGQAEIVGIDLQELRTPGHTRAALRAGATPQELMGRRSGWPPRCEPAAPMHTRS